MSDCYVEFTTVEDGRLTPEQEARVLAYYADDAALYASL